jgi:hypothetical protein
MFPYLTLGDGLGEGVAAVSVLSPVILSLQAHPFNNKTTTASAVNNLDIFMLISFWQS